MSRVLFFSVFFSVSVLARPLTDGVSSSVYFDTQPGSMEIAGQQNLTPHIGLLAGFERESYVDFFYTGWKFGANFLVGKILSDNWRSDAVLNAGLLGLQGSDHGHTAVWSRLDLDWETRNVLIIISSEIQRGTHMPGIEEISFKMGYSPFPSEIDKIQTWFMLGFFSRSGTGAAFPLSQLRLLSQNWILEVGSSLTSLRPFLNLTVGL